VYKNVYIHTTRKEIATIKTTTTTTKVEYTVAEVVDGRAKISRVCSVYCTNEIGGDVPHIRC